MPVNVMCDVGPALAYFECSTCVICAPSYWVLLFCNGFQTPLISQELSRASQEVSWAQQLLECFHQKEKQSVRLACLLANHLSVPQGLEGPQRNPQG